MKEEKDRTILYIIIGILIILIILISMGMVNITILDPQPLQNITLKINITG